MICDMNNVKDKVREDGLEVCIISYGGSCTNALCDILNECEIVTNTPVWGSILCHSPCYYELGIPIIYLYDHPIKSFMSVKRRGKLMLMNYSKMTNNLNAVYRPEKMLRSMINQFHSFTREKRDDVLVLHSKKLFQPNISSKISDFLIKNGMNEKIYNNLNNKLPLIYKQPRHNDNELTIGLAYIFNKYKTEIQTIAQYTP
jgi:hypothetical protein